MSALRPFHAVSWCAGAPVNVYFTPSMFMQQVPKPGGRRDSSTLVAWLRTSTSMPSNTLDSNIIVFAFGGIISSPGAPYTVTLPGGLCAREILGDRHGGRDADRSLRAVLIAVKRALGAAQRVVLDDHAEVRRAVVLGVARDERGRQAGVPICTSKSCFFR